MGAYAESESKALQAYAPLLHHISTRVAGGESESDITKELDDEWEKMLVAPKGPSQRVAFRKHFCECAKMRTAWAASTGAMPSGWPASAKIASRERVE